MMQEAQIISRRSEQRIAPLSFAQQRLWFLQQLEPASRSYNNIILLRLSGRLQIAALQHCLNEVIKRHEALRTSFLLVEAQLTQRVASSIALPLVVVNLRTFAENERNAQIQRIALQEVRYPFDLAHGLLIHACLLEFGNEEHVLLLTLHRIIADRRSIDILLQDLAILYHASVSGPSSLLPELPIQYTDFALWQREQIQGMLLEEHLAYWKQHLDGATGVLQLPTDHQRPVLPTFRGAQQSRLLPRTLIEQVAVLSHREQVTLFTVLLAAFQTLLLRYTGQEDLVVGTPITNRTRPELENLIGLFDNMLALRTNMSNNPTFQQLLQRVHAVVLGAYEHQDLPFEKLVEAVQPEHPISLQSGYNPLFQVVFTYQGAALTPPEFSGLQVRLLEFDRQLASFDLECALTHTEQGVLCSIEYSTDLFEEATISRMLEHFQVLLEGIVVYPERRLTELPLLTESERQQLLMEWNTNATDYPRRCCIQQLFEEQIQRTPDTVAVIYKDEELTYQDLNKRANQLAHYLRALGVGPEVRVGICVERSLEMMIGLLGILKAGGVYVPLDPAYPAERLAFILQDAQVPVLLTQQRHLAQLPAHEAIVLCLDSEWKSIAQHSAANPSPVADVENAAYMIYTSGSTGQPKGVVVEGRSLTNLCFWYKRSSNITQASVVLLMIPSGVDASIKNMLTPLIVGGRLVLAPADSYYDAAELLNTIEKRNVTVINSAPSLFYTIIEAAKIDDYLSLSNLQHLHLGGDPLVLSKLSPWLRSIHCHCNVANIYGPTECTDISVSYTIKKADIDVLETVPIGKPVDNVRVEVLDKDGNLQPIGVLGELCIGGDCLARGYLNNPERTAEKFVPHPFVLGARMYRTGDHVRWLPGGNLEFVGRIDHQVKVRGIRIELGEIEAMLNQHSGVREAVVLAREDQPGEKRLVAYVAFQTGQNFTGDALRNYLKDKLPEYMLPSIFIFQESFPLTASSKVNRQKLPPPERHRPELEQTFIAPRTAVEETLANIWAEALGLERIGIYDNFFSLGGDSIQCIQVVTRARQAGLQLTTKQLFQHQTIIQLAAVIGATGQDR